MARPRLVVGGLLLFIAAGPSGCGYGVSHPARTITLDTAKQQVTAYADQVSAALPDHPHLKPVGGLSTGECNEGLQDQATGRYQASASYALDGVRADQIPATFSAFQNFATTHKYTKVSDGANHMAYDNPKDGFRLGLDNNDGQLSLGVSSPCVWSNGTPPPKSG